MLCCAVYSLRAAQRVVDPGTGQLALQRTSDEYQFTDLYGSVRTFGERPQFSHGIFPGSKNFPPARDAEGRPIDYSLQKYGGMFASRPIRTEEVRLPTASAGDSSSSGSGSATVMAATVGSSRAGVWAAGASCCFRRE